MTTIEEVPRITRPRHTSGVDYGAERVVLARLLDKDGRCVAELLWRKGHKSWADRMSGYQHEPGKLYVVTAIDPKRGVTEVYSSVNHYTLHNDGGRLSRALLTEHSAHIRSVFGSELLATIGTWNLTSKTRLVRP